MKSKSQDEVVRVADEGHEQAEGTADDGGKKEEREGAESKPEVGAGGTKGGFVVSQEAVGKADHEVAQGEKEQNREGDAEPDGE